MPPTKSFQTEEERRRAFEDADIVDTTVLKPTAYTEFEEPVQAPVFPVDSLDVTPPLAPTEPEREAEDITTRLRELTGELVGEAEFRAKEEERREIPALEQAQLDLTSQLKALQAEAKAIPISIQQEFAGRGVTRAGIAPIEIGRLRENAIKALTVSSLLEASRGNLALAYEQVDRATAQKFEIVREEIRAKEANLELLLRSPDYTRAEKNRAQRQLEIQQQRERELEQEQAVFEQIQNIAVQAASKGVDALTLRNIQNAPSVIEATRLAERVGVFAAKPDLLSITEAKTLGVPYGTTRQEAAAMGITIKPEEKILSISEARELGVPFGTTEAAAARMGIIPEEEIKIKPAQRLAAGYASRLEQSGVIIKELGEQFTGKFARVPMFEALKSEDRKRMEQAERNFVNAVLRRESGAAIAPSEFESAKLQYFPQIGDSQVVLDQKERNRLTVTEAMKLEAGGAFAELEEVLPPIQEMVEFQGQQLPVGTIIEGAFGQKGRLESDGRIRTIYSSFQ